MSPGTSFASSQLAKLRRVAWKSMGYSPAYLVEQPAASRSSRRSSALRGRWAWPCSSAKTGSVGCGRRPTSRTQPVAFQVFSASAASEWSGSTRCAYLVFGRVGVAARVEICLATRTVESSTSAQVSPASSPSRMPLVNASR